LLREQTRLRDGRELVANLRCLKCHATDMPPAGGAMRELEMDTPALQDIGQRRTQAWLAHWINNPQAIRADTEMPRMFRGEGDAIDQRARDVTAYLVEGSAKPQAEEDQTSPERVAQGAGLFTGLGCVACHILPGQKNVTETATKRISLEHVQSKFQPGGLKEFLLKPERHFAWIRMPNFRLSDEEATALSAFIQSRKAPSLQGDVAGDAKRGQALFLSSGCINCHTMKLDNMFKATPLAQLSHWSRGCMASDLSARGQAPAFTLADEDRAAITSLAATEFASLKTDTMAEFAERQVAALNCLACHPRDKADDTWSGLTPEIDALMKEFPPEEAKGESEFVGDQTRPPLTWTGEKLRPQWAGEFISGNLKYKPRPWLRARMPGFPARGEFLAQGLALAHGCAPAAPSPGAANAELATVGQQLSGRNGGFSCVQCHAVADQKAFAAFEAPAINFVHVSERLNREYYDRWVYNPQRVQPGMRMPQFADIEGKTALKEVFDGDAKKQFDAIWNYLLQGEAIDPPKN
ncbi:MAG: c-type cytochrome, partial [Tepidisphaeraceae bacterium]